MAWMIGVDVGGTFTDFFAFDDTDDRIALHKVPSTPANPAQAVIAGLRELTQFGVDLTAITRLSHGTTVGTNALIQRRGGKVALVVTEGFRDLIEKSAVDILQPDIYRAGGLSELIKIAHMAAAWNLPVIPHGVGAATYHFVMASNNSPRAEFVDIFAQGGRPILKGEPEPQKGFVLLGDAPGFGYQLDPEVMSGKLRPALIW